MTGVKPMTVSEGLGFKDPAPRTTRYDWAAIAEKCKDNPGDWLLVYEQDRRSIWVALMMGSMPVISRTKGFVYQTRNNHRNQNPPVLDLYIKYDPTEKGSE